MLAQRISFAFLCIFLMVVWTPGQARSTSIERLPLEGVVREAAIVARVRIMERMPLGCGVRYVATVVDSFKGDAGELSFLASSDIDFEGLEPDYLLVAYGRTDAQHRTLEEHAEHSKPTAEGERLHCMLQEKYFVKSHIQMLIPFAQGTGAEEWLRASRMSVVSENRFRQTKDGTTDAVLVSWEDVGNVLRRTVPGNASPWWRSWQSESVKKYGTLEVK